MDIFLNVPEDNIFNHGDLRITGRSSRNALIITLRSVPTLPFQIIWTQLLTEMTKMTEDLYSRSMDDWSTFSGVRSTFKRYSSIANYTTLAPNDTPNLTSAQHSSSTLACHPNSYTTDPSLQGLQSRLLSPRMLTEQSKSDQLRRAICSGGGVM